MNTGIDNQNKQHLYFDFQDEYDYFGEFLINKFVKAYWTAFFILSMYWGFFLFARHIFGDGNTYRSANLRHSREGAVHRLDIERYDNVHSWVNHPTVINIYVCRHSARKYHIYLIVFCEWKCRQGWIEQLTWSGILFCCCFVSLSSTPWQEEAHGQSWS